LTLHGAGCGLDELEAFESEIAGVVDSIRTLDFPERLSEILFVEGNPGRAMRLRKASEGVASIRDDFGGTSGQRS
jgi:hypothetical protein